MTLFSQRRIESAAELPVEYRHRRITDVCCCGIGVLFGLIMFIVACVSINTDHIKTANFPVDSDLNSCMTELNKQGQRRPFLFFPNLNNPMQGHRCVEDCPQPGLTTFCWQGPCDLGYYPTYPDSSQYGTFCLPEDEKARNNLLQELGLNQEKDYLYATKLLLMGLGISMGLAFIWMLLVHCLPKIMVWVAFAVSIVLLVITGILFLIASDQDLRSGEGWAVFLALIAFFMALVLLIYLLVHRKRLRYCGIFLQHAAEMLKEHCLTFLYIPLFIVFTFLFGILIVFQYLAFSSGNPPSYSKHDLYPRLMRNFWFMAPLVIETIWGLSFLRDAFNFCVSGNAVDWYFKKNVNCCDSLKAFFCKHFGSIAGGSFFSAFFFFPNLMIDLCCNNSNCCCCNCLDLPRADAYSYIYMTSVSYCPAVRQSQYLCKRSRICRGTQSTNYFYSIAARLAIALATMLIMYWISEGELKGGQNPYLLLGTFFIGLFVSVYFVDIHIDVAEALLISFLAEAELDMDSYREMSICRDNLKNTLAEMEEEENK